MGLSKGKMAHKHKISPKNYDAKLNYQEIRFDRIEGKLAYVSRSFALIDSSYILVIDKDINYTTFLWIRISYIVYCYVLCM